MNKAPLSKSVSIQELRYMRDQGMNNREIAKALDVSPATVGRYLGPQDIKARSKKHNCKEVTSEMADEIRRMYGEKRSINSIANRFDIGWQTVKKIVAGSKMKFDDPAEIMEPGAQVTVDPKPEAPDAKKENDMLAVLSKRQTIRLAGSECLYEIESGMNEQSMLSLIFGDTVRMILDSASLQTFIGELTKIQSEYLGGAA